MNLREEKLYAMIADLRKTESSLAFKILRLVDSSEDTEVQEDLKATRMALEDVQRRILSLEEAI